MTLPPTTRRACAGSTPPAELPVDFSPEEHAREERRDGLELAADLAVFILFVLALIFAISVAAGYWSAR